MRNTSLRRDPSTEDVAAACVRTPGECVSPSPLATGALPPVCSSLCFTRTEPDASGASHPTKKPLHGGSGGGSQRHETKNQIRPKNLTDALVHD